MHSGKSAQCHSSSSHVTLAAKIEKVLDYRVRIQTLTFAQFINELTAILLVRAIGAVAPGIATPVLPEALVGRLALQLLLPLAVSHLIFPAFYLS